VPALVSSGEAHIGISFNSPVTRGVRRIASVALAIGVVMAGGHPLASKRSIKLRDCIRYPICFAGANVSVAPVISEALAENGFDVDPFVVCNSVEALKAVVREGLGLTFKSALGIEREIERGELVFKPLAEGLSEKLVLIEQTGRRLPMAAAKLQEFLKDAIAETAIRLGPPPAR
jgi:DNA-binding transcriptional LysR family regulator